VVDIAYKATPALCGNCGGIVIAINKKFRGGKKDLFGNHSIRKWGVCPIEGADVFVHS